MTSEKDWMTRTLPREVTEALAALVGRWGLHNVVEGLAQVCIANRDANITDGIGGKGIEVGNEAWAWNESTNALTDCTVSISAIFRGHHNAGTGRFGDALLRDWRRR